MDLPILQKSENKKGNFFQRYSQVLLILSVSVLGVASVALGAVNLSRSIKAPFAFKATVNESELSESLTALSTKDTDNDGLTDADEINFYSTSPYLPDSDSDEIADNEEIKSGTDPNCPTGKTCDESIAVKTNNETGVVTPTSPATQTPTPETPSADEIRNMLRQAGFSDEDIAKLSDEEVIASYYAALADDSNSETSQPSSVTNLSPEQIRQLLLENGIDEATLDKISDDDLTQLYNDTLKEVGETENNR